jgi:type IV secretory pathway TraG/TraD family ATPase VirD4
MSALKSLFLPLRLAGRGVAVLAKGRLLTGRSGARFAKPREVRKVLSPSHTGLLLDGRSMRLTETESFQNIAVIARVGAGKTSRYIIPNVLDKAGRNVSIAVNDPKGEVFAATSGYMASRGFRILVIDPEDPGRSSRFNPLLEARDDIELEQIAEILIRAGNPGDRDPFWNRGAIRFTSLFLKCLANAGRTDPRIFTLSNLNRLLQGFGEDGSALDGWMAENTIDPDNPEDDRLYQEWQGCLTGNVQGIQSFILNALTAMRALSNQRLAWLTGASEFNLQSLREQKTVLYIITPAQHAEYYSFFTSIIFRTLFNAMMRRTPSREDLSLYVLYDEFGHATLPGIVSTANTIRSYRVSLSIVLQSIAQLEARYGKEMAHALQGGFSTFLTYSGADPDTARLFESVTGKVRERQKEDAAKMVDTYREYNLINASEVRCLKDDEALIVSTNRNPILLKTIPYFKDTRFVRAARMGAVPWG